MDSKEYLIRCWHCSAEYNAMDAPFCNHASPSIICPFCLYCSCQAPEEYQKNLWDDSPKELLEEKLIRENRVSSKLGDILIRAGKITKSQLKDAIEKQRILKKRLGEIIVMMDLLTPEELELYLIDQKQVEEIDLSGLRLNFKLIEKIGIDFCVLNKVIPIEDYKLDKFQILRLAIGSETDLKRLKMNKRIIDYTIIPYIAKPEDLEEALKKIKREEDQSDVYILEESED